MFFTGIHMQLAEHGTSEPGFGQHASYCFLDYVGRFFYQQLAGIGYSFTSGIAGKGHDLLVVHLLSGEANLFSIYNYHMISAINVRSEVRFMFANQQRRDLRGKAAKGFPISIYEYPGTLYCLIVGMLGTVT